MKFKPTSSESCQLPGDDHLHVVRGVVVDVDVDESIDERLRQGSSVAALRAWILAREEPTLAVFRDFERSGNF